MEVFVTGSDNLTVEILFFEQFFSPANSQNS
jgi:hypothetical protein